VVKLYQQLFQMDLLLFLKLRYEELVFGGQMVLTFLGRKNEDVYKGDLNHLCGLLALSIQSLVQKVQNYLCIGSIKQDYIRLSAFDSSTLLILHVNFTILYKIRRKPQASFISLVLCSNNNIDIPSKKY